MDESPGVAVAEGPSILDKIIHGKTSAEVRVRVLKAAMEILIIFEMLLCFLVFIFAFVATSDGEKQFQTLFAAVIGVVSGVFGFHGAIARSEMSTRLFFVFQMWLLSALTIYLYTNVALERGEQNKCSPVVADYGEIDQLSCEDKIHKGRVKVFMAVFGALLSVALSVISLDHNDALNDLMAQSDEGGNAKSQRKRRADILATNVDTDWKAPQAKGIFDRSKSSLTRSISAKRQSSGKSVRNNDQQEIYTSSKQQDDADNIEMRQVTEEETPAETE